MVDQQTDVERAEEAIRRFYRLYGGTLPRSWWVEQKAAGATFFWSDRNHACPRTSRLPLAGPVGP
jgi:hypothetical protein